MRGIGNLFGEMKLGNGRLSFTTLGYGQLLSFQLRRLEQEADQPDFAQKVKNGERAVLFDVTLNELSNVAFPWYYLSGGVKLLVRGVTYKLLFSAPNNSRLPPDRDLIEVFGLLGEHIEGRKALSAWKAALLGDK
jgi:hypothetical protein